MRYTLRQLEVFLATARLENITRAAESLAMSQSAASGALRELEQQFGIALFERAGKRLKLNELGRMLLPRAEGLLEQAAELEQSLAGQGEVGALRVAGHRVVRAVYAFLKEVESQVKPVDDVVHPIHVAR